MPVPQKYRVRQKVHEVRIPRDGFLTPIMKNHRIWDDPGGNIGLIQAVIPAGQGCAMNAWCDCGTGVCLVQGFRRHEP